MLLARNRASLDLGAPQCTFLPPLLTWQSLILPRLPDAAHAPARISPASGRLAPAFPGAGCCGACVAPSALYSMWASGSWVAQLARQATLATARAMSWYLMQSSALSVLQPAAHHGTRQELGCGGGGHPLVVHSHAECMDQIQAPEDGLCRGIMLRGHAVRAGQGSEGRLRSAAPRRGV